MNSRIASVVIAPTMTLNQVAQLCAMFTTAHHEAVARIESRNGEPVAYLVREPRIDPEKEKRAQEMRACSGFLSEPNAREMLDLEGRN